MARTTDAVVVVPGGRLVVFDAVQDLPQVLKPDRMPLLIGHDDGAIGTGIGKLATGLDGESAGASVQGSSGKIHVGALNSAGHLVDADAAVEKRSRVESDPHRIFLASEHQNLSYAREGGNPLGHEGLPVFIQAVEGQVGDVSAR